MPRKKIDVEKYNKKRYPYLSEDTLIDILWQHGEYRHWVTPKKNGLRIREYVEYRGMCFYLFYHFTKLSLSDIGKLFKNKKGAPKNHATVLHGYTSFPETYLKYNTGNLSVIYERVMIAINTTLQMKGIDPVYMHPKMSKREAMHYIQHQRKIIFRLIKIQASLNEKITKLQNMEL